ncbi:hypothetical protein B296_00023918 [Ensete ventricosum]|uniref:Uncharacterized protein n=1 Tax=Ensete ventricosum TaxID=4639 RepID=A0A427A406_ENSVE|nr:hypothetical protein B296_00023918 [Ensete ventricosum]
MILLSCVLISGPYPGVNSPFAVELIMSSPLSQTTKYMLRGRRGRCVGHYALLLILGLLPTPQTEVSASRTKGDGPTGEVSCTRGEKVCWDACDDSGEVEAMKCLTRNCHLPYNDRRRWAIRPFWGECYDPVLREEVSSLSDAASCDPMQCDFPLDIDSEIGYVASR